MPTITQTLDLELCRKVLLRAEEAITNQRPNGPTNYAFEGYEPKTVEANVRELHDAEWIRGCAMP